MNFKTVIASVTRVFAIVLVLAVLLPSAVKLTHVFNHHTHEVCETDSNDKTHFHEVDLDCDFYKFKLTSQYYFQSKSIELTSIESNFKISDSQYEFISDYQKLQTTLRGPPQLI